MIALLKLITYFCQEHSGVDNLLFQIPRRKGWKWSHSLWRSERRKHCWWNESGFWFETYIFAGTSSHPRCILVPISRVFSPEWSALMPKGGWGFKRWYHYYQYNMMEHLWFWLELLYIHILGGICKAARGSFDRVGTITAQEFILSFALTWLDLPSF